MSELNSAPAFYSSCSRASILLAHCISQGWSERYINDLQEDSPVNHLVMQLSSAYNNPSSGPAHSHPRLSESQTASNSTKVPSDITKRSSSSSIASCRLLRNSNALSNRRGDWMRMSKRLKPRWRWKRRRKRRQCLGELNGEIFYSRKGGMATAEDSKSCNAKVAVDNKPPQCDLQLHSTVIIEEGIDEEGSRIERMCGGSLPSLSRLLHSYIFIPMALILLLLTVWSLILILM